MKKRVLAALLAFAVLTNLLACGKKAEEPVKEEPETPVVEETKAEPEPVVEEKEAEVVEEEPEEPETDYSWANEYLGIISRWHNDHLGDSVEGYSLFYLNDDDIPELALFCTDSAFAGVDLYTYIADKASRLELHDFVGDWIETEYTIMGRQGQGDSFIEKSGIYVMSGAGGGQYYETGYLLNGDRLDQIYSFFAGDEYEETDIDREKPFTVYSLQYKKKDSQEIVEDGNTTDIGWEELIWNGDSISEVEKEYGFDCDNEKPIGEDKFYNYEEISAELSKLCNEADAEKYKDVEPWKLTYRNLLYDFMSGKKISEYEDGYNDESRFMIKDINHDNNLELLINPFRNRWYVYNNKTASLNDYIVGAACGYDPDSEMFICDLGEGERSQILNIQSYDGKRTILWSDDWDDGDFSYREDGINSLEDFLAGTHDYSIWEYQKDDYENSKNRVPSQEEAKELIEKYVMKEYPISGDVKEINTKNIEAIMDGSVNDNSDDKSDGSLYTVEVTAPDGYVNFRTGAGTDYEIISPISNGETLSVISDEGKWLQVEYQGKTGWVASSQVTK